VQCSGEFCDGAHQIRQALKSLRKQHSWK
jgi:hypothetical protein